MPKLSIENLKVTYGPIVGTDGVALALEAGETLALIGANGAGKSSTLKAVLGMASYTQGRITLDGADLKGLKPYQVIRLGVGYSPEGRRVFPQLSVLDNLRVASSPATPPSCRTASQRIYGYFPRLKERAQPARRQPLGRRAADAGDRPRADVQALAADARRAFARPGAGDRASASATSCTRSSEPRASPCCWPSRTPPGRCRWPSAP